MRKFFKIISLFLGFVILTGCTLNAGADAEKAVANKGKNTYNSISELRTVKSNEADPWLKSKKTLYIIDDQKYTVEIDKIEVGEYITFIHYSANDKKLDFSFEQQQFSDIKEAYKDTASRMENAYELTLNGVPLTIARGKEAVLVSMPLNDYLISLVLPVNISDEDIIKILESIKSESLL